MSRPNIILLIADDLGWGQTGYYGHPHVPTPNIDAIAANGARLDRFYCSTPACSPTRASILTGRQGDRCGVPFQFYRLRRQEKTFVQAVRSAGYRTGLFGKWHLGGQRGVPGAPVLPSDPHGPLQFGFHEYFANTCNIDPFNLMGDHNENIVEIPADSSSFIAGKTNDFIEANHAAGKPLFAMAAFSAPHGRFIALPQYKALFEGMGLSEDLENHFGEIVELDDAVGTIRQKLRDLNIEKDTVVWFFSDNGGLADLDPDATGGLRGMKTEMYEGGMRVPCAVEWPGRIQPHVSDQLAYTTDIALTVCELAGANKYSLIYPQDGASLCAPILDRVATTNRFLPVHYNDAGALITDRWKILTPKVKGVVEWELYDLQADPSETTDLAPHHPDIVGQLAEHYWAWYSTVRKSVNGLDYPEKRVLDDVLPLAPYFFNDPIYAAYVDEWKVRPEYASNVYPNSQTPDTPESPWYAPYDF